MARYGLCSECGTTVWLTKDDACPKGHDPGSISGIAESEAAPANAATAAANSATAPASGGTAPDSGKKSKALVIAAVVVVLLLLCCLVGGILTSIALPVFNSASTNAGAQACFAQQRMMEGATMQWVAEEEGRSASDFAEYGALEDALVPGFVPAQPVCIEDGTYEYEPSAGQVSCSVHGHY